MIAVQEELLARPELTDADGQLQQPLLFQVYSVAVRGELIQPELLHQRREVVLEGHVGSCEGGAKWGRQDGRLGAAGSGDGATVWRRPRRGVDAAGRRRTCPAQRVSRPTCAE